MSLDVNKVQKALKDVCDEPVQVIGLEKTKNGKYHVSVSGVSPLSRDGVNEAISDYRKALDNICLDDDTARDVAEHPIVKNPSHFKGYTKLKTFGVKAGSKNAKVIRNAKNTDTGLQMP